MEENKDIDKLEEDLIGQTIGKIHVLNYIGLDKFNKRLYKVKCTECGEEAELNSLHINQDQKFNCTCNRISKNEARINERNKEVGNIYGKLEILEYEGTDSQTKPRYTCRCTKCNAIIHNLNLYQIKKNGKSRLCNCKIEGKFEDLTGKTFGNIKVLELIGSDPIEHRKVYKVQCTKCGKITEKNTNIIKRGKFDCNCKYNQMEELRSSYIGRKFGDFVVIKFDHFEYGRNYYLCRCDKGHEEVIRQDTLDNNGKKCIKCNNFLKGWTNITGYNKKNQEERNKDLEDLYTHKIFGSIEILSLKENKGNGVIYFNCKCINCGDELVMSIRNIKKSQKSSKCSCNNLVAPGKIFKDLQVLQLSKVVSNKKYYLCKCLKCGEIVECRADQIKQYGHSSKCLCTRTKPSETKSYEERIKEDLTGRIFGNVVVTGLSHIDNSGHSMWVYKCNNCGNIGITSRSNLMSGNTQQCPQCGRVQAGNKLRDDLTGRIFGKLKVMGIDVIESKKHGVPYYKCYCFECGQTKSFEGYGLKHRKNPTCGCVFASTTHGMSGTKIYKVWSDMKQRCNHGYANYGKKGIEYDPTWEEFENFYKDMGDSYQEGLSLERIDNNKNYCKENCRWATIAEQQNNRDVSTKYNYMGEYLNLTEIHYKYADPEVTFEQFKEKFNSDIGLSESMRITKALRNEDTRSKARKLVSFYNGDIELPHFTLYKNNTNN